MENDKWVWADERDLSPQDQPSLDKKNLVPIVEWPDVAPEAPAPVQPDVTAPAKPVAVNGSGPNHAQPRPRTAPPKKEIPPSLVRAIVLHLEGKLEEAILEIQSGLRAGEPPAELHAAIGALQMELEKYEDAAASYRQVLKIEPANESSKHNLAICDERIKEAKKPSPALVKAIVLHMEKKTEEAIKELQRAAGSGAPPLDVLCALGHLHFEVGRFDAAADAYRQVLARQPLHPTCHYNLAVCLEKLGRSQEALSAFEKAFEINPARVEMGIGVGVSLLHLGRFADAAAAFDACLKTHPDDKSALFGKAFALQNVSRLEEAEAAYVEALRRDPAHEESLINLIAMSVAKGSDARVREYCARLLAIRPDSRVALEALLAADLAAGNHEAAAATGERLVKVAPESFEAWFNFGIACHGATLSDEAAAAFSEAARIRPSSIEALTGLGKALQEKGDFAGARTAFESALKISPDQPAVLWNLVLAAEQSGAAADAEKYCALLASKTPESDAVLFRLGSLRFAQADWAGSAEAFQSCLKSKPDSPAAQLNLGLALWKSGKHDEARQKLESISTAPYCVDALHYLAMIAAEREDYAGALVYCNRLADGGERSAELSYNTGLLLQNLGRADEAASQYSEALSLNPDLVEAKQALAQISKSEAKPEEPRKRAAVRTAALAPQLLKSR